ncbi:inositol-tetrakisphosphate 1-kinase 1-like [Andrographis paniculata]|uniref:inositol-tetrakisphosphate 1-kinase 1-like n=1 Tax=Andrographis paniculata TaxID=175694 RepID=UPI0021E7248C|nr:inositol-tetrakisphosphate 1-kinase 1-like [Andrographis paniculata]
MSERATRYRIGYALAPKKVDSFIQPSLLNLAKERGIDLVPIQLTKPLLDQGPFDCIIHKFSHPEWIDQLQEFLSKNPNITVIDPVQSFQRLRSRTTMLQVVSQLNITTQNSLRIPNQILVENPDSLAGIVASKSIEFPVIAKPVAADGTADSHQMSLIFNEEGLKQLSLTPPFILQEFVNHGGVIFKVYVAGQHVQCVKRRSMPDISEEDATDNVLSFSQISNATVHDQGVNDQSVAKLMEAAELPSMDFVNEVASQLRQALQLNLFNFDMIRDSRAGDQYLVIDINYFPGYAKLPCYETMLTDFFLDILQQKQSVVSDDCKPA